MTVKELKEILIYVDDNAEVVFTNGGENYIKILGHMEIIPTKTSGDTRKFAFSLK
jgi:hypothetical protein